MGPTDNDRGALLWFMGLRDMGHVHPGVLVVRLGVAGYDEFVSVGSAVEVCAAFSIVSLDAIISVPSSVRITLFTIRFFTLVFSSSTRRVCTSSVAVNSFR